MKLINELLEAYSDNPVMTGLIRALGVYVLDTRHVAIDAKAHEQAIRALLAAAEYAGRKEAK